MHSIASAEIGHKHTEKLKVGSLAGTIFRNSESGWITQDIYYIYIDWFKYSVYLQQDQCYLLKMAMRHILR